jgi:hypothetical protein
MSHRRIEADGLRTSYAFAPRVTISTTRDGPTSVRLSFGSSPVYQDGQEFRVTTLTFEHVVEYDWNDFEFHRLPGNPEDVEFGLIEIMDSQLIAGIISTGRNTGEQLRHLRICFDDHGTYDVVCQRLGIDYGTSSDSDYYP